MKYSFIVPIYNVESYLEQCVDSLLKQTYEDYEIVLIDDGATDSSGQMADSYAEKYPDIVRVEHQKNAGLGGARNTGIDLARGQYLIMIDSDDYVSEKMLETVEKYLKKYDNDILIFNYVRVEENGEKKIQKLHESEAEYISMEQKQFLLEQPAAWNKVYRASLFQNTGIRYPERIYYEDLATTPCLALHADKIGAIQEPLYYYIQRNSSIMHSKSLQRTMEICTSLSRILEYYKKERQFERYYEELEFLTELHVLCFAMHRILYMEPAWDKVEELQKFVTGYFPDYKKNAYMKVYLQEHENRLERNMIAGNYSEAYRKIQLKKLAGKVKRILCRK